MGKSKSKYYVVWVGQKPGIYDNWLETQVQIKGFPKAKFKSFKTLAEAESAFKGSAHDYIGTKKSVDTKSDWKEFESEIELNSICVDAACSKNPGVMEYRGVVTSTAKELFRMGPYEEGTNNVGEFLALVQALAFLKKMNQPDIVIYTDSKTAMAWVRNKKLKTTLKKTAKNVQLFELIDRAVNWLKLNESTNKIIKWKTERWGEIPADFGRK